MSFVFIHCSDYERLDRVRLKIRYTRAPNPSLDGIPCACLTIFWGRMLGKGKGRVCMRKANEPMSYVCTYIYMISYIPYVCSTPCDAEDSTGLCTVWVTPHVLKQSLMNRQFMMKVELFSNTGQVYHTPKRNCGRGPSSNLFSPMYKAAGATKPWTCILEMFLIWGLCSMHLLSSSLSSCSLSCACVSSLHRTFHKDPKLRFVVLS